MPVRVVLTHVSEELGDLLGCPGRPLGLGCPWLDCPVRRVAGQQVVRDGVVRDAVGEAVDVGDGLGGQVLQEPGGCGPSASTELLGERFVSMEVAQEGQPCSLAAGPLEVGFEDRGRDRASRWSAGCNTVGGVFGIMSDRLRPRVVSPDGEPAFDSTAIDCPDGLLEQDRWLAEVFASSPSWTLDEAGILCVVTDRVHLVLERR